MLDYPPFPGFRDEAFVFLRALRENNDRDWFKPRKETFEDEVSWPLRCLVIDAARRAHNQQLPFNGDPGHSIFRIYRDTRFSKDKRPYKTHAGAILSRSGRRNDFGVVYIHVEPGASFLGAGFWRPDNAALRRWRAKMVQQPARFLEVVHALDRCGLPLEHHNETLKRMPRGFEEYDESELGDYLRWKSFLVSRSFPDDALKSPQFTDEVVRMMRDALPLLEFGWQLKKEPA